MMKWQRDNSVTVEKAKRLSELELIGKIVIGALVDKEKPTYHEERNKLLQEKFKI